MEPINTSPIINLDFATLYPRTQMAYNINNPRVIRRKNKIKKVFNL